MMTALQRSAETVDNPFNSTQEIADWISRRNKEVDVRVEQRAFKDLTGWRFDPATGDLRHETGRFFSLVGLDVYTNAGEPVRWTQPIINQPEIGYLGILAREIDGVMYFLLQAKIEPGNVNCVQLSPTLQATRSNYMQIHGGRKPAYLEYFQQAAPAETLLDQLQSEQGARFLRKRNRNLIVRATENVPCGEDFRWMTLGQIKELMHCDNTINMDTRTVLSGLKIGVEDDSRPVHTLDEILHRLSALKSKYELIAERIPLRDVRGWSVTDREIIRPDRRFFRAIGVSVTISNREVAHWCQPMIEPMQPGICVLFCKRLGGTMHYLLQAKLECGNFDIVEFAPTIQCLTGDYRLDAPAERPRFVTEFTEGKLRGKAVLDVLQSEEGGRFYHEQNRNVIFELDDDEQIDEHENFFWLTLPQIKEFLRFNNYLNIQVRSLVSML